MRNMNLAQKLTVTFSIMLVLFAVVAALLLMQIGTIDRNMAYFYEHPFQVSSTVRDVKTELLQMRVLAKDFILSRNAGDGLLEQLEGDMAVHDRQVVDDIGVLERLYLGNDGDIRTLREKYAVWQRLAIEAIDLAEEGNWESAQSISVNQASTAAQDLFEVLEGILLFANDSASGFYAKADRAGHRAELLLLLFVAVSLIASVVMAYALSRNILRPLQRMMSVIRRVEQGEDAVRVEADGRTDELGKLTDAFNGMLAHMKTKRELQEMVWTLERQQTLEQFRITLMSIGDAVISTDTEGHIVNMNAIAETLTGWSLQEARGRVIDRVFNIVNAKTMEKAENPLNRVLKLGVIVGLANHTVLISKSGAQYHISDSAAPILDDVGKLTGVVLVFRDVTEEYRKQEEIVYMSYHDKLTGLYNRTFLEEEIRRVNTRRQRPLSIIMADINGLKLINDAFGHQMGDEYLISAANTLKRCCRAEDIIARWGGDEFVLLLPKTSEEESQRICARISEVCQTIDGFPIKLSMALGCAAADEDCDDYQSLLKEAETNMYRHKLLESRSVRNAIVESLAKSLNEKDYNTETHARSMVDNSRETGLVLGMKDSMVDELELLAKLHDIGKIAIREQILMKPSKLDSQEWGEMKQHVEVGFRIANSIAELEHIADGILSHHERWDGTGYPKGLAGKSIPYSARIISVADAYDAMTRGRPYKGAVSHEEAIAELQRCTGSQFDPDVVEAFVTAINKNVKS